MKYIKLFEGLNKKNVDPNKIYVYKSGIVAYSIGKINPNCEHEYASQMLGYLLNTGTGDDAGKPIKYFIRGNDWRKVREATAEEIKEYELYHNINKYNL